MALALAFSAAGVMASPAGAASAQSCKFAKGTLTMSPGLSSSTTSDQKVTIKATESGCAPSGATGGTGKYLSVLVLKKANCTVLAKGGITFSGTGTTTWKNGKTTSYTVTYHDGTGTLDKITTVAMNGNARKNLFAGKKFTGGFKINVSSANNGACTSTPFKSATINQTKAWTLS